MPVGTTQFGQADLSKTETYTEAPMTQLGRAAASASIIDHVWFVLVFTFCFTEAHTETPMTQLGRAAASSTMIDHVWFVSFSTFSFN